MQLPDKFADEWRLTEENAKLFSEGQTYYCSHDGEIWHVVDTHYEIVVFEDHESGNVFGRRKSEYQNEIGQMLHNVVLKLE